MADDADASETPSPYFSDGPLLTDPNLMRRAVDLARAHNPHPNPRVGAVVLDRRGRVVGEGAHVKAGRPHAEMEALGAAGERARGGTLYVTLEPCTHYGRTPPCIESILTAGVATVVVGAIDPDERVSGSGVKRLRDEGVEVVEGVLGDEVREADPGYFHHRRTGLPLVVLKYALTLDGAVAASDGSSRWITGAEAREDAHRLRSEVDAVVVGAGTLRRDDPALDVRIPGYQGPQPRPVVVAGRDDLPESAHIWQREPLVVSAVPRDLPSGDLVLVEGADALPDPVAACRALAELGQITLLLEGGPAIAGTWWRAGVVTRGVVYVGARMGGGVGRAPLDGVFSSIEGAEVVSVTGLRSLSGDIRVDFRRI